VRHLFPSQVTEGLVDPLLKIVESLYGRGLGSAVRSLCLPQGLPADQEERYFTALPRLRALYSYDHIKSVHHVPNSLTALVLQAGETFAAADLRVLAAATPNLSTLSLSGHDKRGSGP
jgi:hypothetical protein